MLSQYVRIDVRPEHVERAENLSPLLELLEKEVGVVKHETTPADKYFWRRSKGSDLDEKESIYIRFIFYLYEL